jgi:hypothetical protein
MRPLLFNYGKAVTRHNSTDIVQPAGKALTDGIFVGTAGTITVVFQDDSTVAFEVAAGTLLPIAIKRVNETNTDMTDIVALWQL